MTDYANLSEFDLMLLAEREGRLAFARSRARLGLTPPNPFHDPANRWAWDLGWRCAHFVRTAGGTV